MKRRFTSLIASFLIALTVAGVAPITMTFATTKADCTKGVYLLPGANDAFSSFPAWYNGLLVNDPTDASSCVVGSPQNFVSKSDPTGVSTFIWTIVLNVIQCLTQAAGYIAAIFIIYGGLQFIMNGGDSNTVAKGRVTILNAVIGLVIALVATTIIKFILGSLLK